MKRVVTILHEGASGSGKTEMSEHVGGDVSGRITFGENVLTGQKYRLRFHSICKIRPVTDDMALVHPKMQKGNGKMSAEQMRAYQVDLKKYGFKFNGDNEITNFESGMNNFRDSGDLEKIVELTEEYLPIAQARIEHISKDVNEESVEEVNTDDFSDLD